MLQDIITGAIAFYQIPSLNLAVAQIKLFKTENVTFLVILDLKAIQKMLKFILILKGDKVHWMQIAFLTVGIQNRSWW